MEPDGSPPTSRRKVRFAPKSPARRKLKTIPLKRESIDEDDEGASEAQTLLRQFNENRTRRGPKAEKKMQVVFGAGATTSSSIRSFGAPKAERVSKTNNDMKSSNDEHIPTPLPSKIAETLPSFEEYNGIPNKVPKKEYVEPWDLRNSYFPTTLPLSPPCSGDQEILDAAEFGEAGRNAKYDEKTINPASELGLMEENEEGKMFFFNLPPTLPMVKRPATTKGKEKVGYSASSTGCKLEELPAGLLGKMLVYKSGAVKLKLGNTLYDVSPGEKTAFSQDVMAINTAEKQCCVLGDLGKRVTVTPGLDHYLNSVIDLG